VGAPDSVINALLDAVAAAPDDVDLRRHVADLLQAADRHEEALAHAVAGLSRAPDDVALLATAVTAGRACGQDVGGYERIHCALTGATASSGERDEPRHAEPDDPDDQPRPAQPLSWQGIPSTVDEMVDAWSGQDAPHEPDVGAISRPGMRLADVGGLTEVKQRLERSFLGPMRNPDLQLAFGKAAGGGLVLWGPPGCGKTFLARALAGELGASFYEIGLSEILDMWIGNSEKNLAAIFEFARRNSPCVFFFDELDALGQKRTNLRSGGAAMRGVVNQLLSELDGATSDNTGVFFLAATNHPWDLDPALVRPGRFDRKLLVLPPDREARRAIFEIHLRDRPTVAGIRLDKFAKRTDGYSGADIRLICDDATETALARSVDSGAIVPIDEAMLDESLAHIRPSIGPWLETARNYAMYANDDGDLDDLLGYLKRRR